MAPSHPQAARRAPGRGVPRAAGSHRLQGHSLRFSEEARRPRRWLTRARSRACRQPTAAGEWGAEQRPQEGGDWRRVQEAGQAWGGAASGWRGSWKRTGGRSLSTSPPYPGIFPTLGRVLAQWKGRYVQGARTLGWRGRGHGKGPLSSGIRGWDGAREVRTGSTSWSLLPSPRSPKERVGGCWARWHNKLQPRRCPRKKPSGRGERSRETAANPDSYCVPAQSRFPLGWWTRGTLCGQVASAPCCRPRPARTRVPAVARALKRSKPEGQASARRFMASDALFLLQLPWFPPLRRKGKRKTGLTQISAPTEMQAKVCLREGAVGKPPLDL